jgi:hypothetical protein
MEGLIQGLADESVQEPGWKFDKDIQAALEAIRSTFVGGIQKSLLEAHKADQNHFNCFTHNCFTKCFDDPEDGYDQHWEDCVKQDGNCDKLADAHAKIREEVFESWKDMSNKCGELCCFEPPKVKCMEEDCLCNDLSSCTKPVKNVDSYGNAAGGHSCPKVSGKCGGDAKFGGWLKRNINAFEDAFADWTTKHKACEKAYHNYLDVDYDGDITQRKFERCQCGRNGCELGSCIGYSECVQACWVIYEDEVWAKECLEKDRKIDWSATKRIECYIDVMLHDYSKEELLSKCGSDGQNCLSKAREADYKHCGEICQKVDHNGEWPKVLFNLAPEYGVYLPPKQPVVSGHEKRSKHDQYHLGDGDYECDINGPQVMTRHRGAGVSRKGEERCTEHLDLDFQHPPCGACNMRNASVCDAPFLKKYYGKYDNTEKVEGVKHCTSEKCYGDQCLTSTDDGKHYTNMKFDERSHAWAYNRCECVECDQAYGVYPEPPNYATCENRCGAHTLVSPAGKHESIYGANFDKKVTTQGFNGGVWNGNDADVAVTKARSADMGRRQVSSGNYKADGKVPNVVFGTMCSGRVFGSLAQMEAMCDRDSNCHALHDHNCDGQDWRMCTYTVKEMQDADIDRTACSMVKIDDKTIAHNDKFSKVSDGQCAAGLIEGEELFVRGVDDCWKACRIADDCGFFSHAATLGTGTNCALYTKKAGCSADGNKVYASYQMKDVQ